MANLFRNCWKTSLGGVNELWVANRSEFGRGFLYKETKNDIFGQIIGQRTETPAALKKIYINRDGVFNQSFEIDEGSETYSQTLTATLNLSNYESRDILQYLTMNNNFVVIFKDYNKKYWLMGEAVGCRLSWSNSSGAKGDQNQNDITFEAVENTPIKELSDEYINELLDLNYIEGVTVSTTPNISVIKSGWRISERTVQTPISVQAKNKLFN